MDLCMRYEWDALAYEERDMALGVDMGLDYEATSERWQARSLLHEVLHGPQSLCTTYALTHEPSSSTSYLCHDTCRFYFRS